MSRGRVRQPPPPRHPALTDGKVSFQKARPGDVWLCDPLGLSFPSVWGLFWLWGSRLRLAGLGARHHVCICAPAGSSSGSPCPGCRACCRELEECRATSTPPCPIHPGWARVSPLRGVCVATAALLGLQRLTLWGLKLRPCQTPSGSLQTHTHTRTHACTRSTRVIQPRSPPPQGRGESLLMTLPFPSLPLRASLQAGALRPPGQLGPAWSPPSGRTGTETCFIAQQGGGVGPGLTPLRACVSRSVRRG